MKAIVNTRYGSPDHLEMREVSIPQPAKKEILISVHASTVTAADTMMRQAKPFFARLFLGLFRPKNAIMGTGFAGVVVAAGPEVTRFRVGQAVYGETGANFGANAQYVVVPEDGVVLPKPEALPFELAATLTDGPLTSYNFLKQLGRIRPGQRVLINGASGSLGTAAVQLANQFGAEVTGVASGRNAELVEKLGADHFIDYKTTDPAGTGQTYDLIFDTVGKLGYGKARRALAPGGTYLSPVLTLGMLLQMLRTSLFGRKKAVFSATGLLPPAKLRPLLEEITDVVVRGKLHIVIDRRLPLEMAAEGHRYVDSGRKRGNVVLLHAQEQEALTTNAQLSTT